MTRNISPTVTHTSQSSTCRLLSEWNPVVYSFVENGSAETWDGCCECGNELSGCIIYGEFLD